MKKYAYILLLSLISLSSLLHAQDRISRIKTQLNQLAKTKPGLNETVDLSVSDADIQEFIRGIGRAHNLNISIDSKLSASITNTFSDVQVKDLIVFLCKHYDLSIDFTEDIMFFKKYIPPPEPEIVKAPKKLDIQYSGKTDFLSLNLRRDSLFRVAKEITRLSTKNVILAPGLENRLVNAYIQNRPIQETVEKLAYANGLEVEADGNFLVLKLPGKESPVIKPGNDPDGDPEIIDGLTIQKTGDLLTITAHNVAITDIIKKVSKEGMISYFMFNEPKGNANFYVENMTYDRFLSYLLNGTDYDFKIDEQVYMIGKRDLERLRDSKLIQMENRTIESVIEAIPNNLKNGLNIVEFKDLNGFVVSGSALQIRELEDFIHEIDVVVPLITIEVLIVDYSKSRSVTAGLTAGIGQPSSNGNATLLPGAKGTINAATINALLNSFNGFGLLNLGGVSNDFYVSIQALEEDGVLKTRSTPQISTLNGHQADLSIGRTEYYLELQNQIAGNSSVNPIPLVSQNYKSVSAALSVTITPFVSSDEQVTLEVVVEQSDLTERISDQAPPGKVTRKFNSMIRVKNGEMILLGGLEDKSVNNSGSGLPFLARIPILKWIFGTRTRSKSKSKLNIFIKPVIHY